MRVSSFRDASRGLINPSIIALVASPRHNSLANLSNTVVASAAQAIER